MSIYNRLQVMAISRPGSVLICRTAVLAAVDHRKRRGRHVVRVPLREFAEHLQNRRFALVVTMGGQRLQGVEPHPR